MAALETFIGDQAQIVAPVTKAVACAVSDIPVEVVATVRSQVANPASKPTIDSAIDS